MEIGELGVDVEEGVIDLVLGAEGSLLDSMKSDERSRKAGGGSVWRSIAGCKGGLSIRIVYSE